jgi:GNAT superfamily N-acetyltransferase
MDFAARQGASAALVAHFLTLPLEGRRLRFSSSLYRESIAAYVDEIDLNRDAVFGVHDDRLALVGVAHVALVDDLAELGLSVLPAHRGYGVGGALFERAAAHARNRSTPRLVIHFLKENARVLRIARGLGMDIVTDAGDVDSYLELQPASPRVDHRGIRDGQVRAVRLRAQGDPGLGASSSAT